MTDLLFAQAFFLEDALIEQPATFAQRRKLIAHRLIHLDGNRPASRGQRLVTLVALFDLTQLLEIRWRAWMTHHYLARWLNGSAFYRLELARFQAGIRKRYSDEDIVTQLQECARRLGRSPSMREFAADEETTVHPQTVIEHFGSWNAAKRAAGLGPRRFATREELLQLLRDRRLHFWMHVARVEHRDAAREIDVAPALHIPQLGVRSAVCVNHQ